MLGSLREGGPSRRRYPLEPRGLPVRDPVLLSLYAKARNDCEVKILILAAFLSGVSLHRPLTRSPSPI